MTDAYKNFIEMEADTLPDINVFYETIIATLNEQLKEANKLIKWADKAYNFGVTEELSMFGKYLEKWGVE